MFLLCKRDIIMLLRRHNCLQSEFGFICLKKKGEILYRKTFKRMQDCNNSTINRLFIHVAAKL